jgi:broad specificity phosphatase PhoE
MTEIYFVRHGQASFGAEDYDKLSIIGHKQSELLGLYLKKTRLKFDKVICGKMKRHKETLAGINKNLKLNNIIFDGRLNELNYQNLEKAYHTRYNSIPPTSSTEFRDFHQNLITAWASKKLEGLVESYLDFNKRVNSAVDDHVKNAQRLLVISSGGPKSMLVTRALNLNYAGTADILNFTLNSSYSVFSKSNNAFTLLQYNCVPHLDIKEKIELKTFI